MRKLVLSLIAACSLLAVPDADGYIFWSSYDSSKSKVGRAGLDASGVNGALVTDIYYGAGVATDGQHVYWGESGSSPSLAQVGRATVDGGEANHAFQNGGTFCGIFGLRATASHIYWLKSTCSGSNRTIDRVAKSGGAFSQPGTGLDICGFDVHGSYVYWSEGQYIARAALTEPPSAPEKTWLKLGTGFAACAVTANDTHIYWTNQQPAPAPEYRGTSIGRAAIGGDPNSVENEFLVNTTFFTGASLPSGIAVSGDFLYWTNQPPVSQVTGSIGRANLDGTGVDYSFIDNVFDPVSLDVDSQGPAPAPAGTGPKPTRPPPPPMRIVGVSTSNPSFTPGGASTPVRLARGLASGRKGKGGAPRGTVFSFTLNQDADVTVEVKKLKAGRLVKRKCKRPKRSNAKKKKCDLRAHVLLRRSGRSGKNRLPYTGRVKRRALKPGRYKALFTATGEGGDRKTASVGFKIVRP